MTRNEIVTLANQRTEFRLEAQGLDLWFIQAIQRFARESRFWWRKSRKTFVSVPGTQEYDLFAAAGGDADDLEQIMAVLRATDQGELDPIVGEVSQEAALQNVTNDEPSGYFIKPGTTSTLCFNCPAASAKTYALHYWAIPNPSTDTSDDTVPLVPPIYHAVIADAMVADICEQLFGSESTRYLAAKARYDKGLMEASRRGGQWSDSVVKSYAADDATQGTTK